MIAGARLTAAVLGTPDPRGLVRSSQRLLVLQLSFQREAGHVPPVWPPEPDTQQMQVHLDIEVDDLDAAAAVAQDAGARFLSGNPQARTAPTA